MILAVCCRPSSYIVECLAVLAVVRRHIAGSLEILLRVEVPALAEKHTALQEVPLGISCVCGERIQYQIGFGKASVVYVLTDACKIRRIFPGVTGITGISAARAFWISE